MQTQIHKVNMNQHSELRTVILSCHDIGVREFKRIPLIDMMSKLNFQFEEREMLYLSFICVKYVT